METDERLNMERPKVNKVAAGGLVAAILLVCAGIVVGLIVFKPEAKTGGRGDGLPRVRVVTTETADFQVVVRTQGVAVPEVETQVASEVSGRVSKVGTNFKRGGKFEAGEVLLEIDPADYEAAVVMRRAELEDARLALLRAEIEVEKGRREWERLGSGGEPNPLVLGLPQLEQAKAGFEAAEAGLERAERDLERTKIKAPYNGRVRSKSTDLGSYVTTGSPLAELFASDILAVRLPVSQADFRFLNERLRSGELVGVRFSSDGWETLGKVVRVEGEIDFRTRSHYLIAGLRGDEAFPGQFLEAEVEGEVLAGVIELPRKAVHGRNRVYVVREKDGRDVLEFCSVEIVRRERERVLIRPAADGATGLQAGMRVVVTPLAAPIEGMGVNVVGGEEKPAGVEVPG